MKRFFLTTIVVLLCLYTRAELKAPTHLMIDLMCDDSIPITQDLKLKTWCPKITQIHPLLGWQIVSTDMRTSQTAFRVLVASTPSKLTEGEADIWDSGKKNTSHSISIKMEGKNLNPSEDYYWKVKVWDNHGNVSDYSKTMHFRTAQRLDESFARYPLTKTDTYPTNIKKTENGWIVDYGKDAFGQLRLTLYSNTDKDTITIHLGEDIKDGKVKRKPEGTVRYCNYQLPLKRGTHTYQLELRPDKRNTNPKANVSGVKPILMPKEIGEVYPFRYVELEGYRHQLKSENIVHHVINYPFHDNESAFECSDETLNKIWDLCKYSIKATSFCGVYVDGDRERIPYEADTYINQLSHYGVDNDYTIARYTIDYLMDYPTWPTEWILQGPLMVWHDYLYTGDTRLLCKHYELLKAHALLSLKDSLGLISTRTEKLTPEVMRSIHFKGKQYIRDIVDWPQSGALGVGKEEAGEADGYDFTSYNTVVNAYHYEALKTLVKIAKVLGKTKEAATFQKNMKKVGQTIDKYLYDEELGCYKDGLTSHHHSLHASMFPLCFGLGKEKRLKRTLDFIHSRKMACSVYGAQFLLDALYEAGDADYALNLMTSHEERSWMSMLKQGSTITLEAWGSRFKPNLDWNHAWGSAPANIIPRKLMGVEPILPGCELIRIKPQHASLKWAKAVVPTIRGNVKMHIDRQYNFKLRVEIPANMEAEVWMPSAKKGETLMVNGKKQKCKRNGQYLVCRLKSGMYELKTTGHE